MKKTILLCIIWMLPLVALGQKKTLLFFADKAGSNFTLSEPSAFLSEKALQRRTRFGITLDQTDLPVSQAYLDSLRQNGAQILYTSKWFNAALVSATEEVLSVISAFPFITESDIPLGTLSPEVEKRLDFQEGILEVPPEYGNSFDQLSMLGIDQMHRAGFKGEGMTIGIIDAGFANVDEIEAFDSLFYHGQIKATFDFVDGEEHVYDDHRHGMQVLAAMAAYMPGGLVGSAFKADYYLFRTENVAVEERLEEFYWALAAEYADSAGVDILTASLGYNLFDSPIDSYATSQMDGQTTMVTLAAGFANQKGMLVVTSAGNEGNDPWQTITAPADHPNVLAVGAVDAAGTITDFSSTGPTADGRIKPDLMAQGRGVVLLNTFGQLTTSSGTSFAAPLVAGFAAGAWQALPHLSNLELLEELRKAGSIASEPNNEYGYGIPAFSAILEQTPLAIEQFQQTDLVVWPNPSNGDFSVELPEASWGGTTHLSLFDMTGRELWGQTYNLLAGKIQVELNSPLKGAFLLKVTTENGVMHQRIVISP